MIIEQGERLHLDPYQGKMHWRQILRDGCRRKLQAETFWLVKNSVVLWLDQVTKPGGMA
jgi:hypothetical protein